MSVKHLCMICVVKMSCTLRLSVKTSKIYTSAMFVSDNIQIKISRPMSVFINHLHVKCHISSPSASLVTAMKPKPNKHARISPRCFTDYSIKRIFIKLCPCILLRLSITVAGRQNNLTNVSRYPGSHE